MSESVTTAERRRAVEVIARFLDAGHGRCGTCAAIMLLLDLANADLIVVSGQDDQ